MLNRYLIKNGIVLEPQLTNKWHVLEYLTRYFCRQQYPEVIVDGIFETVLLREMIVSTGLGGGVALPHARTNLVERTGLLFARFKNGIKWDSLDGSLVYFVFLIIGPVHSANEYLYVLSKISKMLSRKPNRQILLKTDDISEISDVFHDIKDREAQRIDVS